MPSASNVLKSKDKLSAEVVYCAKNASVTWARAVSDGLTPFTDLIHEHALAVDDLANPKVGVALVLTTLQLAGITAVSIP